jgi:DNA mismatch repair protein PMS2
VRDVLASRACRSAIMVGRALRHGEMVRELRNMVGLDQPWNCPHGRPTMRHLAVLAELEPRRSSAGEYLLYG